MGRAPHDPTETATELAAALRRNHPELTDREIAVLLSGPPKKRRPSTSPRVGWVDNRGRRESRFEKPSTGRTTSKRGVLGADAEAGA